MQRLTDLPPYELSKITVPDLPIGCGLTWLENGDVEISGPAGDDYITSLKAAIYAAAGVEMPVPGYREQRAAAYIRELSPEGNFQTSTGDLMDALIKAVYGDKSELDELVSKIAQIKSEFPPDEKSPG